MDGKYSKYTQSTMNKVSVSVDDTTIKMMKNVKRHYNISNNSDLFRALIKRAHMNIK